MNRETARDRAIRRETAELNRRALEANTDAARLEVIRAAVDRLAERLEADPPEGVRARLADQIARAMAGTVEPRAKLSGAQRRAIVAEYDRGDSSYRSIAKKYGVAPSTVLRVVKR